MRPYEAYQLMMQKQANVLGELTHAAQHVTAHELTDNNAPPSVPAAKRIRGVKRAHELYFDTVKASS